MIEGLDVSNNNRAVDWPSVAASGIRFAWCKATEGTRYRDPYWNGPVQHHRNEATRAGLKVGAYHFAHPGDAIAQARYFCAQDIVASLPPVLDLENPPGAAWPGPAVAANFAVVFLTEVERLTGVHPMLYTYSGFALAPDPRLAQWPLWLANYGRNDGHPHGPLPPKQPWGTHWSAWQYTSKGHVPGVPYPATGCDCNQADPTWWASLDQQPQPVPPPVEDDVTQPAFIASATAADPKAIYATDSRFSFLRHVSSEAALAQEADWATRDGSKLVASDYKVAGIPVSLISQEVIDDLVQGFS